MVKFMDIPRMSYASYQVNVSWNFLEKQLASYEEGWGLELNPDFQRGHVWTDEQRSAYCEWILRGGRSGKDIFFNCPGWSGGPGKGNMVCVDGLQRITAVRMFLRDEISVFGGSVRSDFEDSPGMLIADFIFHVNDLPTRAEVLQWYIDLNSGGTVHKPAEIENVRELLAIELGYREQPSKDPDQESPENTLNYKWVRWVYRGDPNKGTELWTNHHLVLDRQEKTLCDKQLPVPDELWSPLDVNRKPGKTCKACERRLELYGCPDCGYYVGPWKVGWCPNCQKRL